MTKRYDEPIEVTVELGEAHVPASFRWRGRRYDVDQWLEVWREAGELWTGPARCDREFVRVLAHPAGVYSTGELDADGFMRSSGAVYDLYLDRVAGGWRLARVWD